MICPAVDQIPLAAIVYLWAWLVLVAWSWRYASAQGTFGRIILIVGAGLWPLSILLVARLGKPRHG
jgi:hypothetical protein